MTFVYGPEVSWTVLGLDSNHRLVCGERTPGSYHPEFTNTNSVQQEELGQLDILARSIPKAAIHKNKSAKRPIRRISLALGSKSIRSSFWLRNQQQIIGGMIQFLYAGVEALVFLALFVLA